MPEDAAIIGQEPDMVGSMGDGSSELETQELIPGAVKTLHPDCREKGTAIPLGFMPHQGENRATRRKASATFSHPEFSRREGLLQRRKHQRGKLDPELRRLQHERLKQK